jgi:hypothetical protein
VRLKIPAGPVSETESLVKAMIEDWAEFGVELKVFDTVVSSLKVPADRGGTRGGLSHVGGMPPGRFGSCTNDTAAEYQQHDQPDTQQSNSRLFPHDCDLRCIGMPLEHPLRIIMLAFWTRCRDSVVTTAPFGVGQSSDGSPCPKMVGPDEWTLKPGKPAA